MDTVHSNYNMMCIVLENIVDNINDNEKILSLFSILYRNEYKVCITICQLRFINRFSNKFDEKCFKIWNYLKYKNIFIVKM